MFRTRPSIRVTLWLAPGLLACYLGALRTRFLSDDYVFLEQAARQPLFGWLFRLDALGNYWRPLSRQIYFEVLNPIAGGNPLVFHGVNFALFLIAIVLLADLLSVFAAGPALVAGVLYFALLPMQRVNLIWISCSQDLLALAFSLAALALWRRDRRGWALGAWLAAIASKESALPLPLVLGAWDLIVRRASPPETARRLGPFVGVGAGWLALMFAVRTRNGGPLPLHFDLGSLVAAFAHLGQSLLGIEHPAGFLGSLLLHPPPLVPLLALAMGVFALGETVRPAATAPASAPQAAREAPYRFAAFWLLALTLIIWPVVYTWSGYYYTLAAVGAALLVALATRRLDKWGAVLLAAGLLWWHTGGSSTRAFAIMDQPWGWTSHVTTFYFTRGAALADTLTRQLRRLEPAPEHGSRFFFATLPPWAGFQRGNGPLVRAMYRDTSLQSYYYSQFGDSSANAHPCRFYYWDGAALQPLYARAADPYFQVGCDLLLLDRPGGAAHAFRRAIETGGRKQDNLYWLGWASLWSGEREIAESAWHDLGARDDSLLHFASFVAVKHALYVEADTLKARRLLMQAIEAGMGEPNPHAVLGELLWARGGEDGRYGLMELKVATFLNPRDVLARRELIGGLLTMRLDDPARTEMMKLKEVYPDWRNDSLIVNLSHALEARAPHPGDVASFAEESALR
jgi:hypothetical protein